MPIFVKMAETSNINFKMFCRLCLSREGEMFSVYGRDPSRLTNSIREKILFTTSIKFPPNVNTPAVICTNCDILLNGFFIFRKRSHANSQKAQALVLQQNTAEIGKLKTSKISTYQIKTLESVVKTNQVFITRELGPLNIKSEYKSDSSRADGTIPDVVISPIAKKPILINAENGKSILEAVKKATTESLEPEESEDNGCKGARQGARIKTPSRKASEQCLTLSDEEEKEDEEEDEEDSMEDNESFEEEDILKYLKLEMAPNNYAERKQCVSPNGWGVMMIRRCAECGAKFTALSELRKHKAELGHSDPTCDICKRTFFSPVARDNHVRKKHKTPEELALEASIGKKQRRCPQCEECFPSLFELRKHKMAFGHLTPQCNFCQRKFISKDACERHLRKKHKVNNPARVQSCSICGMSFGKKKDLQAHINVHLGVSEPEVPKKRLAKHLCSICGKGFSTIRSVQQHKNSVHSLPKTSRADEYTCPICSKVFHYKKRLEDHVSLHIGFMPAKANLAVTKIEPPEVEEIETTPSSSSKKAQRKKKTYYRYESDTDFVA